MAAMVVDTGKAAITALLASSAQKYVGWGTGSTAEAHDDTDLATAANESRVSGTQTQETTTYTDDTYQVVAEITSGSSQSIQEVGVFDAAGSGNPPAGGNLFLRAVHGSQSLGSGDSIEYTVKTQFS